MDKFGKVITYFLASALIAAILYVIALVLIALTQLVF